MGTGTPHRTPEADPKGHGKGPVYEVDGALELLNESDVMPVMARDGIEQHYTFEIPVTGVFLDPRLELGEATRV